MKNGNTRKAGLRGTPPAAEGTPGGVKETLGALVAEIRKAVGLLETIAGRVESVRRTLWRMQSVREYDGKGAGKAEEAGTPGATTGEAGGGSTVAEVPGKPVLDLARIPAGAFAVKEGGAA